VLFRSVPLLRTFLDETYVLSPNIIYPLWDTIYNKSVTLRWDAIKNAPSYDIIVDSLKGNFGGAVEIINDTAITQTSYTVSNLVGGKTYNFEIRIHPGIINSDWSFSGFFTSSILSVPDEMASVEGNLSVWPNPANDVLNIQLKNTGSYPVQISLTNILGDLILKTSMENNGPYFKNTLDVSGIASGIYLLRVQSGRNVWFGKVLRD
jgi:hypothetical protein